MTSTPSSPTPPPGRTARATSTRTRSGAPDREAGAFNLFVDEGAGTRHMLYRLYFSDATGRPLTLAGYKDVRPGPITEGLARDLNALHPCLGRPCAR